MKKATKRVNVEAKAGGLPTKSTWTLIDRGIAEIDLATGTGQSRRTSVTKSPRPGNGLVVKVTIKSVSKAGVAEDSWIQDTDQDSTAVIPGSFSGEISISSLNGPSVTSCNGSAMFDRRTPDLVGGPVGSFDVFSGTSPSTSPVRKASG